MKAENFPALSIPMLGVVLPVDALAVTKAFVSVTPMFPNGHVKKWPEAAFLCIIETVVEGLCGLGKFFHFRGSR
jgi:hypothetical protein